jgi:hypothetical protein
MHIFVADDRLAVFTNTRRRALQIPRCAGFQRHSAWAEKGHAVNVRKRLTFYASSKGRPLSVN